jgi:hypothetical protein
MMDMKVIKKKVLNLNFGIMIHLVIMIKLENYLFQYDNYIII